MTTRPPRAARILAGLVSLIVLAAPIAAQADRCRGVTMPPSIDVDGQTLVLNGMGLREATAFNVDVYVAGLYLPERIADGREILRRMPTMRLALELVRDVERGEMNEAIREGFTRNGASPGVVGRLQSLERLIPDLHQGDRITFTYRAEGGGVLVVHVNGRLAGRVEGAEFARAVFSTWLGSPPNVGLKRGLLGGRC